MRPALALIALALACKPTPLDLGDDPDATTTDATTPDGASTTSAGTALTSSTTADTATTDDTATTADTPDNPAGVCDPSNSPVCPTDYICCSDDPATTGGRKPNYFKDGLVDEDYGTPIFSGANNELSTWGRCVDVGEFASPFASGCPVACNPTWAPDVVAEMCGVDSTCCQFTELDPEKDCVLDPDTGSWRAVTGHDIPALTSWGDLHTTNQDPLGVNCQQFSGLGEDFDQAVWDDCLRQLTVADQRGFCYAADLCPCREDLCDMKNPGWVPRCP